jgi:AmiR/NasT family two-component response regulator
VYRAEPGMLPASELALALTYADVAMQMILDTDDGVAATAALLVEESTSLEVYQAQGVAMTQLGVGGAEALSRMRANAYTTNRRLTDVANDILGGRLKLQPDKTNSQRMLH